MLSFPDHTVSEQLARKLWIAGLTLYEYIYIYIYISPKRLTPRKNS